MSDTSLSVPEQVEQRVIEVLIDFGAKPDDINREARFDELDIDSIDLVELAQIVKDEFDVEMEGRDIAYIDTVGGTLDFIGERLKVVD